jgi:hypothetical protein
MIQYYECVSSGKYFVSFDLNHSPATVSVESVAIHNFLNILTRVLYAITTACLVTGVVEEPSSSLEDVIAPYSS